jgi:hypothetical protein
MQSPLLISLYALVTTRVKRSEPEHPGVPRRRLRRRVAATSSLPQSNTILPTDRPQAPHGPGVSISHLRSRLKAAASDSSTSTTTSISLHLYLHPHCLKMEHFHLPSFSNSALAHAHGHSGPSAPSPQSGSPSHLASPSAPPTSREDSDAGASGSVVKKRKRLAPRDGTASGSGSGSAHADTIGIRSTQRVPLSCKECSRRKIKCDKMVPCRPCIDRGEEGQCRREAVMVKGRVVVNDVPPRDGTLTLESLAVENADIRRRLGRLERSLARSPSLSPPGGEEALEFKEDRLAGVMEEVALGIGENVRWKGVSLLTDPETNAAGKDQWYHSVPLEAGLSTIPNRVKCDALVRFYAEDLSWIIAAIHVPTFLHQHEAFWATSDRAQVKDDNWLAVFFAVLSFAGYFMEDPQAQLNGFQAGEVDRLAKIWFDCSIAILFRNNFAAQPTFTACQAILTLMYPFHLSGNTGLHVGMSSVLKSHARAMNLHLLGSSPGASKEDRLAREMGRRLWWNIVADDWTFLPYNRYCSEWPSHHRIMSLHRIRSLRTSP